MALSESNYHIPRNDTFASGLPLSWIRETQKLPPLIPEQSSVTVVVKVRNESPTDASQQGRIMVDTPFNESPFLKFLLRIENLKNLGYDWNSYGANAPNQKARFWAKEVLHELLQLNFTPSTVTASSDEGVAIFFRSKGKRASIECMNSGEILGVLSKGLDAPEVWAISQDRLKHAVKKIQTFFSA